MSGEESEEAGEAANSALLPQVNMEVFEYDFEVQGEVIKMIHNELPAVRWTCGGCGEDACTIFYDSDAEAISVECEFCHASNFVHR